MVDGLLDRGFLVFAINPKQADRARELFVLSGAKDDPRDAEGLSVVLRTVPRVFRHRAAVPAGGRRSATGCEASLVSLTPPRMTRSAGPPSGGPPQAAASASEARERTPRRGTDEIMAPIVAADPGFQRQKEVLPEANPDFRRGAGSQVDVAPGGGQSIRR